MASQDKKKGLLSTYQQGQLIRLLTRGKEARRKVNSTRLALTIFIVLLITGCGTLTAAYALYNTAIHGPLKSFLRPVSRDTHEPSQSGDDSQVLGRAWNILLLGSDNDRKYSFPAILTQVMMVVRVDTLKNTVTMVSIPRDSWVPVPQIGGMHKIDQAFLLGSQKGNKFEDGVRLARLTIESDYGIPIDRYAWVGLDGFAKIIDTLGGVDVNVPHAVTDEAYPNDVGAGSDPNNPFAYRSISIAAGPHHFNGDEALQYVRSRHDDPRGDVGRTERQQQVLIALKPKLNASSLIQHMPQLLKDLNGSLYTDLSETEILAFANYGRSLPTSAVQHLTLGYGSGDQNYGEGATVFDPLLNTNQSVILPHCDKIQPVINRIFDVSGFSCNIGT
jgi:LCP family protein required for cell wall assembly